MPIRCGTAQPLLLCKKGIRLSEFKCWSEVRWLQRCGPGYDPRPMVSTTIVPGNDNRIILITVMQLNMKNSRQSASTPNTPKLASTKIYQKPAPVYIPPPGWGAFKVGCSGHLSFAAKRIPSNSKLLRILPETTAVLVYPGRATCTTMHTARHGLFRAQRWPILRLQDRVLAPCMDV